MRQHSNFDSTMEARDHFKNGASSKSQKSRENFSRITQMFSTLKKMAMIVIFAMFIAGTTNAQSVPKQLAKTASRTVKIVGKSASREAKLVGKSISREAKLIGNSVSRTVRTTERMEACCDSMEYSSTIR